MDQGGSKVDEVPTLIDDDEDGDYNWMLTYQFEDYNGMLPRRLQWTTMGCLQWDAPQATTMDYNEMLPRRLQWTTMGCFPGEDSHSLASAMPAAFSSMLQQ